MGDTNANEREEGTALLPRFDKEGLVTAIVVDSTSLEPLMLAHMNAEALERTLQTGEAHFWSRSRSKLWHKGATSGNVLKVEEIRIDCDQDALWVSVAIEGHGAACHTGRKSCFYRRLVSDESGARLEPTGDAPLFDPKDVYDK
ncbi:phosphoribosyl-AMP cyclohydrolase [Pseudahrensia aquimaris]|uniref:Phosphoribosyl-AMP cyclohydrolase n=1 Tax=Pseudahrensia aquimaris TaxID=744461 RepID=A0ABW3FBK1_9HYPH